jgi:hypothetical protein
MRLIFDIETDGLYRSLSTIHCVAIYDIDSDQTLVFNDQGTGCPGCIGGGRSIANGISLLDSADLIIGHNIIYYDIPVIQKFFPWFNPAGKAMDTLLLSRLTYPDLKERDFAQRPRDMSAGLYGRHSLEAWGYRLNEKKDDFGKTTDWSSWSPELEKYMVQDVHVTTKLWFDFHKTYPGLP